MWEYKKKTRASTLSLTTTTFMPPALQTPAIVAMTPNGGHEVMDYDFRQRYEEALRDAMTWEKKYSSAQHQIHYEREQWEGNDVLFFSSFAFRSANILTMDQIAQQKNMANCRRRYTPKKASNQRPISKK